MALAGDIQEFGLADIFQIVSLQQKTGELSVEGKEGKVVILLENGFIVGADATFRPVEERLRQSLVRSGKISKFDLKRATESQKKTLRPLWTVLVELNIVDTHALQKMLSQQTHETVYHLLRWTEGTYRFDPKKSVEYDKGLVNPVNTEFLIMEGFRITDEWSQIENVITSFQLVIHRTSGVSPPDDLNEAEAKVYRLLEKDRTIQDLIDAGQLGEFDTCQTIYDLMKKSLVEQVKTKKGKTRAVRWASVGITDILAKAFTLIVGIAILVGVIVLFRYLPENFTLIYKPGVIEIDGVKRFAAQSQLNNFSQMISRYFLEHRKPPASFEDLKNIGFISSDRVLNDPWGRTYSMDAKESGIVIRSAGDDGKPDTDDDISMTVPF